MPLRKKRNFKNLTLGNSPVVVSQPETVPDKRRSSVRRLEEEYDRLCEKIKDLEPGLELRLDLRPDDFENVDELGRGNGGTVCKVLHVRTNTVMAKKIIHVEANMNVRKQIMRELQFMHDCNSRHIVSFYGAFMNGGDISICMEYMDVGSLDRIYKKHGPIPLDVLGKIAYAIVDGLIYLYDEHRIIHRDLKPSNVLVNSQGQIKLCDFGVSGQLINSVADTFVGTSSYMSPERIMGSPYSVKSDVWSLGISLMELALARFPFPPDGNALSIFELLQHIVNEPVPSFPPNKFPDILTDFVDKCLVKDVKLRATPSDLMKHEYLVNAATAKVDLVKWACNVSSPPERIDISKLQSSSSVTTSLKDEITIAFIPTTTLVTCSRYPVLEKNISHHTLYMRIITYLAQKELVYCIFGGHLMDHFVLQYTNHVR